MDAYVYKAADARLRAMPLWFAGVLLLFSQTTNASNTWFDKADVDRVNSEMRDRGRDEQRRIERLSQQNASQSGKPLPRVVTRPTNEPGVATEPQRTGGMRAPATINSPAPAPHETRSYSSAGSAGSSTYECDKSAQSARNEAGSVKRNSALTNAAYDIANSKCRSAASGASDKSSSLACEQARRSYENEASSLKKDWNAINAKRRAMQQECG